MRYVLGWSAFLLSAAFVRLTPVSAEPAPQKGLVVHEWGVFRAHQDADMAKADVLGEWRDLPQFVYGQVPGRTLPVNWGPVEFRRRPIIFFHAPAATQVRLRIDFPGGLPGVWFPGAAYPVQMRNVPPPPPKVGDYLEWNLGIHQPPPGHGPRTPTPPKVDPQHWIARLRAVKSDELFSVYGDNTNDVDREKFIYYDGLFPQGKWLRIDVAGGQVKLSSPLAFPVHDVTVVDQRDPSKPRIGRLARLEAGATGREIDCVAVDAAGFSEASAAVLVKQLTAAGLYEDEARSLADLWKKELFETTGLHVYYRIPQEEYEKRLPMTLTPKAETLVRVGLVYHGHCEPDLAERVLALAKLLDNEDFAVREKAQKDLERMGRGAHVELGRLRKTSNLSPEAQRRIDDLLEKWAAQKAPG
jgi:hypothetical protein